MKCEKDGEIFVERCGVTFETKDHKHIKLSGLSYWECPGCGDRRYDAATVNEGLIEEFVGRHTS